MKIEKGIPIPVADKGGQKPTPLTVSRTKQLSVMEIMDSFVEPDAKGRQSAVQLMRQIGFKATTRKLEDGTYRIWRIG